MCLDIIMIKIQVNKNIELKQIERSDSEDIFNTINTQREYLGRWLPFVDSTQKIEDTQNYIQRVEDSQPENRELVFVIHYAHTFAGLIGFKSTDKQNKKTEIGYWLSEPFQKKGIIISSVKALVKFAFDEMDINRIQIKCATGNIQSKRIPQKLNFTFEGVERDGELLSGSKFTDIEVYSLLRKEL